MKRILSVILLAVIFLSALPTPILSEAETYDSEINTESTDTLNPQTSEPLSDGMQISSFGIELIKSFEGFHPNAEWDYSQWSIGYGCRCEKDEYPNGITEYQATQLLKTEIVVYVNAVNRFINTYSLSLTQNQFDALVSFSYNCGQNVWTMSENDFTLKKLIVSGKYTANDITNAFLMWVKAGGQVLQGLVRRRTREAKLFNSTLNIDDSTVAQRFVSVKEDELNIRENPSTTAAIIGSVENTVILPITKFSSDGKWAYTPYGAFFGWVSTDYLLPLESAPLLDENMRDAYGIKYTLGDSPKTIVAGDPKSSAYNNSMYDGLGDGNIYLSRYIRVGEYVYCLTEIANLAFYGNKSLKSVHIPISVTKIGKDSFATSSLHTVYAPADSYAAEFAAPKGYTVIEYACRDGHIYSENSWKVLRKVSCMYDGLEGKCCDRCGYIIETRLIDKAYGHEYLEGVWQTYTELTCITDRIEGILCKNCGQPKETRVIEKATGHKAGAWITLTNVSCTADGVKVKKCTKCEEELERSVEKAHHTYDSNKWVTAVEPTCTEKGEKAVLCDACGAKMDSKAVSELGHSYGSWYVTEAPTYLKTGISRRDCKRCSNYQRKILSKLKSEIVSDTLKLSDTTKRVEGIAVGTTVKDVLKQVKNSENVKVIDKNSKTVPEDALIGSKMRLILYEGSKVILSYTFIIMGDADGDGHATDWDCILLGRYLAAWSVNICTEALDFDKNGDVNDWDEILFSRYLAGWDIELW